MFIAILFITAKKMETTRVSINYPVGKQNGMYSLIGILFHHKKTMKY